MAPTRSVPAAFHFELSEYASLLRAIRTTSTLDIVPQLARPNPHVKSLDSGENTQLNDSQASREASEPTQDRKVNRSSKGKVQDKFLSKTTKRSGRKLEGDDNWTRWPLLNEHCPIPEWTFDEEVMAVAEQCLRFRTSVSQDPEEVATSRIEDDDINEFILSPAHLSGLTSEAASKLTSTLSLLASHRLSATFTKHGRLAPMSWLDVLEVVGVVGVFGLATVEDVKKRMEAIFGQSQSQIITRMQVLEASRCTLAEAEVSFGHGLPIIQPPSSRRRKKRKHGHTVDMPAETQKQVLSDYQASS